MHNILRRVVIISLCVVGLVGCLPLKRESSMMNAEALKQRIQNDVATVDDAIALFPKTVEEVKSFTKMTLENAQKEFESILSLQKSERTFDNTAQALDTIRRDVGVVASLVSVLEMVHPQKDMRDACHEATLQIEKYLVDALHNKDLYSACKDYAEGNAKQEAVSNEGRYYLKELLRDFERSGLNLPREQLENVKKIKKEIAEVALNFETNIAKDQSFIAVAPQDLAGVSDDLLKVLKKDDQGRYILRCNHPTYVEVMEHCSCEQTRKKFYFAYNNRAYPQNDELLRQLVAKRYELARKLGFASFAALDIDGEMAKKVERVETFLLDLINKSTPKSKREVALLKKELPAGIALDAQERFDAWSLFYVKNCYKKKHLEIDEHKIAEYFPVEKALEGVFSVYQQFLGLKFSIIKPSWVWHEDVRVIQINDALDNALRGYLFIDLYPRDNKYSHACLAPIVPTLKKENNRITPSVAMIIANFPRSTPEKPALLKFEDVSTFFHEFGHAMHNLLGSTELASQSGTSVKTDFVEMPSQMFEEWLYDRKVLQSVSGHFKTGQPLPDELIDKMIKLKQFDSGMFVLRQSVLALYALKLFNKGEDVDPKNLLKELSEQYISYSRFEPEAHFYAGFGHLASSLYASKYYNYLWAKVFALDVFYKVKQEGLLNAQVGHVLVDKILGKGGGADPDVLLKNYLGREPNSDAFLTDLGIA